MAWLDIKKAPLYKSARRETPDGLWHKCASCSQIIYRRDYLENQQVCPKCHHHSAIGSRDRLGFFLDPDSFVEHDGSLESVDPLQFQDRKAYSVRLEEAQKKTGMKDALLAGEGKLRGRGVQVGVFEFAFMGGSMGCVVGEKISRVFKRACEKHQAAILFSSSGGARMQEGALSLMQMAKTCTALAQMRERGVPMISVMTNPTTGGVAASFAMLGDINIGEPGALIGFAGPRVIQQTTGQSLPEGFQRSEYLLEHGMLDMICHRASLRHQISQVLDILVPDKQAES